ncbi:tRNA-(ms[2]io[6]A)-hydroxylase [Salinibius halmophilus]|uniref:tRNA-(ms[2]io[6]A)-hydroxylase n=1 Tax=Salinibius halmophilus TaxID=1853216 RepID=UPI000E662E3D|nr:tRNA-(ms[2]io[6]A)-hydroxylase [Salinibius halmophilus]
MREVDLQPVKDFLACETPDAWVDKALTELPTLLIDHAQCEHKAAASAMSLMYRHAEFPELLDKMSQLVREEILHFEQVIKIMRERGVEYGHQTASRYAAALMKHVRNTTTERLVDKLIIGAFVEARSCERFNKLVPVLDDQLGKFYHSLLRSEARHFEDYLELAEIAQGGSVDDRVAFFREKEAELILSSDRQFRFHSGIPA